MKSERQAAVQAVLDAGHIPAGMELFQAGNNSQLDTVKRWIDESDVYMLILGGRYGSIEPISGNGYIEVEYKYALSKTIPVFSVVLSESFLSLKASKSSMSEIFEQQNKRNYDDFKQLVMTKMVKYADDEKDIKLAIHATLKKFLDDYKLSGWIKSDSQENPIKLLTENRTLREDNTRLSKENQKLEKIIEELKQDNYNGFSYIKIMEILGSKIFDIPAKKLKNPEKLSITALEVFELLYDDFCTGIENSQDTSNERIYIYYNICPFYMAYGLLEQVKVTGYRFHRIQITKTRITVLW